MYGMVNQAIEDLVIECADEQTWRDIQRQAGLDDSGFEASVIYDDAVTLALVAAASDTLNMAPEKILRAFGRHWILYTGRE